MMTYDEDGDDGNDDDDDAKTKFLPKPFHVLNCTFE